MLISNFICKITFLQHTAQSTKAKVRRLLLKSELSSVVNQECLYLQNMELSLIRIIKTITLNKNKQTQINK